MDRWEFQNLFVQFDLVVQFDCLLNIPVENVKICLFFSQVTSRKQNPVKNSPPSPKYYWFTSVPFPRSSVHASEMSIVPFLLPMLMLMAAMLATWLPQGSIVPQMVIMVTIASYVYTQSQYNSTAETASSLVVVERIITLLTQPSMSSGMLSHIISPSNDPVQSTSSPSHTSNPAEKDLTRKCLRRRLRQRKLKRHVPT